MNYRAYILSMFMMAGTCATYAQSYENYEIVIDDEGRQQEIDLPESMTADLDELLDQYHTQTYMQLGTDCNMRNEDPEFETEEYIERLKRIPSVMEMPYNEPVRRMIDRYSKRLRRQVSYMLGASNFYMPIFEQALETYGLPLELKYLPVIESALNPKAVSRVGATGLWQFMLETGKRYDLKVNSLVDERRDPVKASNAAARFLKDLYRIFGDWNLVIAAYNAGPERINKAIHRAGGEKDYWKIYPYLPKETRGYVPAFIAANYIMTYYCDHNICPMETELPARSDTIMLHRDVHFDQISNVIGIDSKLLKELNPQYRRDIINGNSGMAELRLPAQYIGTFIDKEDSVFNYNASQLLTKREQVDVEEEASSRYRSRNSYHQPTAENKEEPKVEVATETRELRRTDSYKETPARPVAKKAEPTPTVRKTESATTHKAQTTTKKTESAPRKAETTSRKAETTSRKHESSSRKAETNTKNGKSGKSGKDNSSSKSGKSIRTSSKSGNKSRNKKAEPSTVTVKKGESLSEIAEKNHTTVSHLKKINGMKDDKIRAGKEIKVK